MPCIHPTRGNCCPRWAIRAEVIGNFALKEWETTAKALHNGEQTILFRKGGIREPTFTPAADKFLLLGTTFHSDPSLLKAGYVSAELTGAEQEDPKHWPTQKLHTWAEVTGAWKTFDASVIELLDPLHIYEPLPYLERRLKWRRNQPITVLELRVFQLNPALEVPTQEEWYGCFSWAAIKGMEEQTGLKLKELVKNATPALNDASFGEKQKFCRERLKHIEVEELHM